MTGGGKTGDGRFRADPSPDLFQVFFDILRDDFRGIFRNPYFFKQNPDGDGKEQYGNQQVIQAEVPYHDGDDGAGNHPDRQVTAALFGHNIVMEELFVVRFLLFQQIGVTAVTDSGYFILFIPLRGMEDSVVLMDASRNINGFYGVVDNILHEHVVEGKIHNVPAFIGDLRHGFLRMVCGKNLIKTDSGGHQNQERNKNFIHQGRKHEVIPENAGKGHKDH